MIKDITEDIQGRKLNRMGREENAHAWINMSNDFMLNSQGLLLLYKTNLL